jgi:hypothetical protein
MPYQKGYDVLPKLEPLSGPIFDNKDKDIFLAAKNKEAKDRACCFYYNIEQNKINHVCDFISSETGLKGNFEQLAMQLKEDIIIHCMDESSDWFAAGHVCFPSGWKPENRIGQSFYEIHKNVPKMRLSASRKIVEAMIYSSPYERYVWTIAFDKTLSDYPSNPKKQFDINNPEIYVKYERQCIIGFPKINSALFTICQNFIEEKDIDKSALLKSLLEMSGEHILYKNLQYSYSDVIAYLRKSQ